jgi:ubiquinone/menaquinone biosynthesis C-methylase UbiE
MMTGHARYERLEAAEWLDQGHGTPADVAANLAEMARTNRWLGGLRALTRHLYPRLSAAPGPLTVLDLGTGSADVPLAIARWGRRHGREVRVLGLDGSSRNLAVARAQSAREPRVRLLRADAERLPLAASSVDYVISTLFLHHLQPDDLLALLRAAAVIARRGLVMSDLARGRLPLAAFRLVQPAFARHPFTRHDGALSIRRAYTHAELTQLARAAGLSTARVHAHFPWRLTLVADLAGRG